MNSRGILVPALFLLFVHASVQGAELDRLIADADIEQGRRNSQQCQACHSLTAEMAPLIGPSLWNIIDRPIASQKNFSYGSALSAREGRWNAATLDLFLQSPQEFAPGTTMVLPGIGDAEVRASIIRFLQTLSGPADTRIAATEPQDPFGDSWPEGEGRAITGQRCNVCHSLAIVKQQRLDRDGWDEVLEWMVEEQGMPELNEQEYKAVMDYLLAHFSPDS